MKKKKKPDYCERPSVKSCDNCSLVNYGRDCYNFEVHPDPNKPECPGCKGPEICWDCYIKTDEYAMTLAELKLRTGRLKLDINLNKKR